MTTMTAEAAALTAASKRQQEARDNWPKDQCPGRGRIHPASDTTSCPWCLPDSWWRDYS